MMLIILYKILNLHSRNNSSYKKNILFMIYNAYNLKSLLLLRHILRILIKSLSNIENISNLNHSINNCLLYLQHQLLHIFLHWYNIRYYRKDKRCHDSIKGNFANLILYRLHLFSNKTFHLYHIVGILL